jgi:transcriptional regulator of arginine metabolism
VYYSSEGESIGMKSRRQRKIQELITERSVRTQEELVNYLNEFGFIATQATISRDIKEMGLVKVPGPGEEYRYAMANEAQAVGSQERLEKVCRDVVTSVVCGENIVVIKTLPGNAQALAILLDNAPWQESLGTVAGDDTVFLVAHQRAGAESIRKRLESYIDG